MDKQKPGQDKVASSTGNAESKTNNLNVKASSVTVKAPGHVKEQISESSKAASSDDASLPEGNVNSQGRKVDVAATRTDGAKGESVQANTAAEATPTGKLELGDSPARELSADSDNDHGMEHSNSEQEALSDGAVLKGAVPEEAVSEGAVPEEAVPEGAAPLAAPAPSKRKKWFDGDKELIQEDLDYMSSAAAAVLQQSPRGGQQLLWAICTFVVVAVVWASLAYVDEFTRGEGKVIPSSQVKVVQHQEGGIVAELFVREGQAVKAKEPLLRLDDTQFSSSLREADVTLDQLKAKAERLSYEADGVGFPEQPIEGVGEVVWSQERALYLSRREEQNSKDQVLVQQISQRNQELSELKARRDQHQRSYRLLDKELQISKPLVSSGAMSQVELLRLERQVNDLYGELNGAELAIPRVESSLQEARDKLHGSQLAFGNESRKELADVRLELQRLSESSGALEDRVDRTLVISPVAGTIKQVMVNTIGGVIQPGMDLIKIVPTEDRLLVEAKIRPTDIAFLHPGQEAIVKFTAYDFSIHGGLKGKVTHISPDTIVDEEGESFYTVRVETEKAFLGHEDKPLPIIPGMTVSVDVLTGEKTVLDYILKPILKTKQLALRER